MALRIFKRFRELLDVDWSTFADGDVPTYNSTSGKLEGQPAGAGGGAPTDVDYLVGTASGDLSAEIVVGTAPGGELGGTWASPTVDATHSGSSHASVQAAAEATAAAALSAHDADTTGVHGIADTSALALSANVPSNATFNDHSARHEDGGADEISIQGLSGTPAELTNHLNDTSAAHAASAISADSTTLVGTGTDVQAVLEELDNGIADHLADSSAAHAASAISFSPTGSIAATDVQAAIAEVASEAGGGGGYTEIAYNEITSNFTTTATTEGTAGTVVTASAFTADGTSAYLVEFWAPRWFTNQTNGTLNLYLYLDGSSLGLWANGNIATNGHAQAGLYAARRIIPSSGSRTFSARAATGASTTLTISAGGGGAGTFLPAYIRITKVT